MLDSKAFNTMKVSPNQKSEKNTRELARIIGLIVERCRGIIDTEILDLLASTFNTMIVANSDKSKNDLICVLDIIEEKSTDTITLDLWLSAYGIIESDLCKYNTITNIIKLIAERSGDTRALNLLRSAFKSPHYNFLSASEFGSILSSVCTDYGHGKKEEDLKNELLFVEEVINYPNFLYLDYSEMKAVFSCLFLNAFWSEKLIVIHRFIQRNPLTKSQMTSIINELEIEQFSIPEFDAGFDEENQEYKVYATSGLYSYPVDLDLFSKEKIAELRIEQASDPKTEEKVSTYGSMLDKYYDELMLTDNESGQMIQSQFRPDDSQMAVTYNEIMVGANSFGKMLKSFDFTREDFRTFAFDFLQCKSEETEDSFWSIVRGYIQEMPD